MDFKFNNHHHRIYIFFLRWNDVDKIGKNKDKQLDFNNNNNNGSCNPFSIDDYQNVTIEWMIECKCDSIEANFWWILFTIYLSNSLKSFSHIIIFDWLYFHTHTVITSTFFSYRVRESGNEFVFCQQFSISIILFYCSVKHVNE
jgi:hypothetical protein